MTGMLRYIRPILQNSFSGIRGAKNSVEEKLGLPSKPKKPATAFINFLNAKRSDIVLNNPKASVTDVSRIGGELWRQTDERVRAQLQDEYKRNFEAYLQELAEYEKQLTDKQRVEIEEAMLAVKEEKQKRKDRITLLRRLRELNKPLKPLTSFLLFYKDEAQTESFKSYSSLKEQSQRVSQLWAALPESKKAHYQQKADAAKAKYEKELNAWETKMIKLGNLDVIRQKTLESLDKTSNKK